MTIHIDLSTDEKLNAFCQNMRNSGDLLEAAWRMVPGDVWFVLVHRSCYRLREEPIPVYEQNPATYYFADKDPNFFVMKEEVDAWEPIYKKIKERG